MKQIHKFKHGEMDRRTTTGNELTIVRWKDSKSVCIASNCDSSEPMSQLYKDGKKKTPRIKLQSHNHFLLTSTTRKCVG